MKKNVFFFFIACLLLATTGIEAQIITTFAGMGMGGHTGDGGAATAAKLDGPWGIVTDSMNNIYFCDCNRHVVRKISNTGIITTIAGTGADSFSGNGGPAVAATFSTPRGIARDEKGNIYIADQNNHQIRKIDTGGIITVFAGTGTSGFSGDGGPATNAKIFYPQWLAFDHNGNLFMTDFYHVIRKIDTTGIITTIAGDPGYPGYSGDGGPASVAKFHYPTGICFDRAGNMFIADNWNNVVRKINTAGIVTTVAGSGTSGFGGDSGLATSAYLHRPLSVTLDTSGNLFVSDQSNSVIRMVSTSGIITSVVGRGGASGYSGDLGRPDTARLSFPRGIAFDRVGRLYIADGNYVIRRVEPGAPVSTSVSNQPATHGMNVYPNPTSGTLNIRLPSTSRLVNCSIIASDGKLVYANTVATINGCAVLTLASIPSGTYTIVAISESTSYREVISIR
jgi:sugar lactone lactonase YvrE